MTVIAQDDHLTAGAWAACGTYNVRVVWLPGVKRTAFVGALETCWRERTYCSHRGINGKIRSLQKHSA